MLPSPHCLEEFGIVLLPQTLVSLGLEAVPPESGGFLTQALLFGPPFGSLVPMLSPVFPGRGRLYPRAPAC